MAEGGRVEETIFEIHELLGLAEILRDSGQFDAALALCDQIAGGFG